MIYVDEFIDPGESKLNFQSTLIDWIDVERKENFNVRHERIVFLA